MREAETELLEILGLPSILHTVLSLFFHEKSSPNVHQAGMTRVSPFDVCRCLCKALGGSIGWPSRGIAV